MLNQSKRHATLTALLLVMTLAISCNEGDEPKASSQANDGVTLDVEGRSLSFQATAHPSDYDLSDGIAGHHFITWQEGGGAGKALFRSQASDRDVAEGLRKLGAVPGENLTIDTWDERKDRDHPAPKTRVEGTTISITVSWEGSGGEIPIDQLVSSKPDRPIDIRFGGNEAFIDYYGSGCVTCLFSCPGGKTANASATVRDQIDETIRFVPVLDRLPKDGTVARVTFRF